MTFETTDRIEQLLPVRGVALGFVLRHGGGRKHKTGKNAGPISQNLFKHSTSLSSHLVRAPYPGGAQRMRA
jgi:hypothetical protein